MKQDDTGRHPLVKDAHLQREAWVYLRQSTQMQVETNTGSQLVQRSQADFARKFGWTEEKIIVVENDLGITGSSIQRRTDFQRLTQGMKNGTIGAVFVVDLSRLSRELIESEGLRLVAAVHDVLIVVNGHVTDPRDYNDTFVNQLLSCAAMFENNQRIARMTSSKLAKAKNGEVVSPLPTGYIRRADGTYNFDPETQNEIQMVFAMIFKARSARKATSMLDEAGIRIPTRRKNSVVWNRPTVPRVWGIARDETYTGTYVFHKTTSARELGILPSGQSRRKRVPESEWIRKENNHPAYISMDQHREIVEMLQAGGFRSAQRLGGL